MPAVSAANRRFPSASGSLLYYVTDSSLPPPLTSSRNEWYSQAEPAMRLSQFIDNFTTSSVSNSRGTSTFGMENQPLTLSLIHQNSPHQDFMFSAESALYLVRIQTYFVIDSAGRITHPTPSSSAFTFESSGFCSLTHWLSSSSVCTFWQWTPELAFSALRMELTPESLSRH